jgi:hypothetical protein
MLDDQRTCSGDRGESGKFHYEVDADEERSVVGNDIDLGEHSGREPRGKFRRSYFSKRLIEVCLRSEKRAAVVSSEGACREEDHSASVVR